MKRSSAVIVFLFVCIGMWVTHGLSIDEVPNSESSSSTSPDWFDYYGNGWGWSTDPPQLPQPPPSPPAHQKPPQPPPSPPAHQKPPPAHQKQPPAHQKQPPAHQKQPPLPPGYGYYDPILCGQDYAAMQMCLGQMMSTYGSGRLYVSEQCCRVIRDVNTICSTPVLAMQFNNDFVMRTIKNYCHA